MNNSVQNTQRRTMIAFTLQGVFFFIGYCFFDVNTVIPLFVETFTGRVELAGVANTIRQGATLGFQLLLGTYIIKVKYVPRYLSIYMAIGYCMPLFMVFPLLAGARPEALVGLLFLAVAVMWSSDGFVIIGYYDLLGRTVSPQNRGRVLGLQQLIGGAGAMVGAFVVKKLLDMQGVNLTQKYSIIFGLGGVILLCGAAAMAFTKDVENRKPETVYSLKKQLKKIPRCVAGNKVFRKILYCQICFLIAMMSAPYILIMGKEQFSLADNVVSTLLNFQVLGTLIGGAISAFLAPRFGNKIVVIIYCGLCACCAGFGLFALLDTPLKLGSIFLMVVTSGLASASWAGFMNVIIDVAPQGDTPIYMVINSLISLPLSLVGIGGGQIIKYFGYGNLLFVCFVFAGLALLMGIQLYKQSRKIAQKMQ